LAISRFEVCGEDKVKFKMFGVLKRAEQDYAFWFNGIAG